MADPDSGKETLLPRSLELEQKKGQIKRLCSVVRQGRRRKKGELIFIGWTRDGKPAITSNETRLSEEVQESLKAFERSGLEIKEIYLNLIPVEYAYTGAAIDFRDQKERKAEDLINYGIKDEDGKSKKIALGELAVLEAIADSQTPWQDTASSKVREIAVAAKPMYILFVSTPEMDGNTALAILFKPTIEGESNEAAFKSFIRQTIGRLLVLDESQDPENRKGYMKAAEKFAGKRTTGSPLEILLKLRQTGFIEFEDNWLKNLGQRGRNMLTTGLKLARSLGLVEVDEDLLEEYKHPLPHYDVDKLDINRLFSLTSAMRDAARRSLQK